MNIESIGMAIKDFTAIPYFWLCIGFFIIIVIAIYLRVKAKRVFIEEKEYVDELYKNSLVDDDYSSYRTQQKLAPIFEFELIKKTINRWLMFFLIVWPLIYLYFLG
ncbi:hypothetical protein [Shewanella xiamenensis]|uniref:hypothetical protein n=1 Tax=Shewanella xiamenensis TaxID=332186 RepID=UPI00217B97FF|nr:hypothetical protein [Shewanella xiamenensis]BDQ68690.1 hypothetical protein NUITMVS2_45030 [Shewanella xiamenensis]GLD78872.1 hypothetical protein NUITMVS3_33060 [Shewanella xiamenensis]